MADETVERIIACEAETTRLRDRLERAEKRSIGRDLAVAAGSLALGLGVLLASRFVTSTAQAVPTAAPTFVSPPRTIVAESFLIRDPNGKVRGSFSLDESGRAALTFSDARLHERAVLAGEGADAGLTVYDAAGDPIPPKDARPASVGDQAPK